MRFSVLSSSIFIAIGLARPQITNPSAAFGQVNYYSDQDCSDWLNSVTVTWGMDNVCFDYYIENAGSMNVANYFLPPDNSLSCWFYTDLNCVGAGVEATYGAANGPSGNKNCVSTAETRVEPVSVWCSDFFAPGK